MVDELEVPAGGETLPAEEPPGPGVTPEGGEPAPQSTDGVDEGTGPGVDALLGRLASGAASANDQEMVRRLYGHTEKIKTLEGQLEAAQSADPWADVMEEYIREECRGDKALEAEHRRWIASTPRGARDYVEAVHYRRAKGAGSGGQPDEETEEQLRARLIKEEVDRQLAPQRERQEKEEVTATFVTSLDSALQGMKLSSEVSAHVREGLMGDMTAWLKTSVRNFNDFLGVPKGTQMADHIQKRATKLQALIDAVQAGRKAPPTLPTATPAPARAGPPSSDEEEEGLEEMFLKVGRKHDAKMESGGGAS